VRALRLAPLRAAGKYSYAMYVLQRPLHDYVAKPAIAALGMDVTHSIGAHIAYLAATIALTFLAALVSWHVFEKRFLDLKRRFVPK
jgi:peptidoglycan/LPS O-acetylase OafA/YrhL